MRFKKELLERDVKFYTSLEYDGKPDFNYFVFSALSNIGAKKFGLDSNRQPAEITSSSFCQPLGYWFDDIFDPQETDIMIEFYKSYHELMNLSNKYPALLGNPFVRDQINKFQEYLNEYYSAGDNMRKYAPKITEMIHDAVPSDYDIRHSLTWGDDTPLTKKLQKLNPAELNRFSSYEQQRKEQRDHMRELSEGLEGYIQRTFFQNTS